MRCLSRNIECAYPDAARKKASKRKRISLGNVRLEDPIKSYPTQMSSAVVAHSANQRNVAQQSSCVDESLPAIGTRIAPEYAMQYDPDHQLLTFSFSEMDLFPSNRRFLNDTDFLWDSPDLDAIIGVSTGPVVQLSSGLASEIEYSSDSRECLINPSYCNEDI
jgi:hypothetical protein